MSNEEKLHGFSFSETLPSRIFNERFRMDRTLQGLAGP